MGKILGIDYGGRRIGLALADVSTGIAMPFKTIYNDETLTQQLEGIITEHQIEAIVVGLPRNLDADETAQTAAARNFVATFIDPLGLPVYLQDEAATSAEAKQRLQAGKQGRIEKGKIDMEAASIILQDYLDAKKL